MIKNMDDLVTIDIKNDKSKGKRRRVPLKNDDKEDKKGKKDKEQKKEKKDKKIRFRDKLQKRLSTKKQKKASNKDTKEKKPEKEEKSSSKDNKDTTQEIIFEKVETDDENLQKDTEEPKQEKKVTKEVIDLENLEEIINKRKEKSKKSYDQSEIEIVRLYEEQKISLDAESEDEEMDDLDVQEGGLTYYRTGFGWKGQGSRRVVFDDKIKEYRYEIIEPKLSKGEKEIRDKLIYFFRVRADVDVFDLDEKEQKKRLEKALDTIIEENHFKLTDEAKNRIYYYVFREFMGYGKIDILMHDEGIEDISCDGIRVPIFIFHKDFDSIRSNIIFEEMDELDSFVVKLSQMCGKQISVYEPIVDGKLNDGSRLQTTLSRTITRYSTFTIRRFREDPLTPIDLVENNTMSIEMAAYFWIAIEKGTNILFCGGTASGKTTALNALSLFLPSTFKIVSIEDTREINLPHENWIAGTTRTGFTSSEITKTGKDIDMFDLIKVALRQRPRVIIVGEVRGREAYTLFQAMTTGHLSYSTVHASDMHTLIQRLENKPIDLPRALLTSLDIVVFLNSKTIEGFPVRRITNVTEIIKLDPGTNRLVTITPFTWISEVDDRFENAGGSRIMQQVKMQFGWDEPRLKQEFKNRGRILQWMMKQNLRSYEEVGRIVAQYSKDPQTVMKMVEEDNK